MLTNGTLASDQFNSQEIAPGAVTILLALLQVCSHDFILLLLSSADYGKLLLKGASKGQARKKQKPAMQDTLPWLPEAAGAVH